MATVAKKAAMRIAPMRPKPSSAQRIIIAGQLRSLVTSNPLRASQNTIPFAVHGSGSGVAQNISIPSSPHSISTDAYPAFGGKDSAPSPLHYNLTSLSSCTQVTGSLVAKDLGLKLGKWEVAVQGSLDPGVLMKGIEGNANWKSISLNVKVEAEGVGQQKFDEFARETERRCPVTQLFKRSGVEWTSEWKNSTK